MTKKKTIRKPTKKEIEDIKNICRKEEIDHLKLILDKLVSTLAEYGLPEYHWTALGFKELANNEMKHLFELMEGDNDATFHKIMFGDREDTPESIHKENVEYYEALIKKAEHKIEELPFETRKLIIMDGLKNHRQWDYYWNKCSKLIAKQEKKSKAKAK